MGLQMLRAIVSPRSAEPRCSQRASTRPIERGYAYCWRAPRACLVVDHVALGQPDRVATLDDTSGRAQSAAPHRPQKIDIELGVVNVSINAGPCGWRRPGE
jgi:hypothetical protein